MGWEIEACKRLIDSDRKVIIAVASKTNWFASKRVAHSVPSEEVKAKFSDLDESVDILKKITEKYTALLRVELMKELQPAHRAGRPTIYPLLAQLRNRDLLSEMKSAKLPEGWDKIFLEPWATDEILALPLGELAQPSSPPEPGSAPS